MLSNAYIYQEKDARAFNTRARARMRAQEGVFWGTPRLAGFRVFRVSGQASTRWAEAYPSPPLNSHFAKPQAVYATLAK